MTATALPSANGQFGRFVIGLGGLVLAAAVWYPWDTVTLSFSGPTRVVTHYGLLSPWEIESRYTPRRIPKSTPFMTELPQPDETEWNHGGVFDEDTIAVKVQERTTTVHYLALAGSLAASFGLVWLTVLRRS